MRLSSADQGLLDAARYGTGKLLTVWLKRGANPAAASPVDDTSWGNGTAGFGVWHWLVDHRHDALLHELRNRDDTPFPLTLQDARGNTAAHLAAERHPNVWAQLWTPEVARCQNQDGDTALDVLRRHHPAYVPNGIVNTETESLSTVDLSLLDVRPSNETGAQDPPDETFPPAWSAPPTPDPSLPGEAGISPEAWKRRLWAPNRLQTNAMQDVPNDADREPLTSWPNLKSPSAIPGEGPLNGEQVLDPLPINENDAWVVDLDVLLRPASLLNAAAAGRSARPLPDFRASLPVSPLRLLDRSFEADGVPFRPLDEHPEETVSHAFIADPTAWAASIIQERCEGVAIPLSLNEFQPSKALLPARADLPAWTMNSTALPVLLDDSTAPPSARQGVPKEAPAWSMIPMGPGPEDLLAAVAKQMTHLEQLEVPVPTWAVLPMTGVSIVDPKNPEDHGPATPVVLEPVKPPGWTMTET